MANFHPYHMRAKVLFGTRLKYDIRTSAERAPQSLSFLNRLATAAAELRLDAYPYPH
jgi:hypothetical protein